MINEIDKAEGDLDDDTFPMGIFIMTLLDI
jgi:hypothetical protein